MDKGPQAQKGKKSNGDNEQSAQCEQKHKKDGNDKQERAKKDTNDKKAKKDKKDNNGKDEKKAKSEEWAWAIQSLAVWPVLDEQNTIVSCHPKPNTWSNSHTQQISKPHCASIDWKPI